MRRGGRALPLPLGLAGPGQKNIHLSSFELTLFQKRIEGALFGGGNPFDDIPLMLDLYREDAVSFEQVTPMGELYVTWTGSRDGAGDSADGDWTGHQDAADSVMELTVSDA